MKVLITGISGFVGEYLAEKISDNNSSDQIFGLERNVRQFEIFPELNKKVKIFPADITNEKEIKNIIQEILPDQVYHLAGFASASGKDEDLINKVNVIGTNNLIKALGKINKKVKVLLVSTAYVYGNTPKPAKETDKIKPFGFYAVSKAEMEKQALEQKDNNLEIVISRAVNHSGPGQRLGFVIPDFVSQIIEAQKGSEIRVGNLEAKRDFLDVKDVVNAYTLLMNKGKSSQIYNISSGKTTSIKDLLKKIIDISKKEIKIIIDPEKIRKVDIKVNCLDSSKLRKMGWKSMIRLEDTLENVLKYYERKNDHRN